VTGLCPTFNGLKKMKVFFRTGLNVVFFGLVFVVFFVSIVDAAEVKNAISRQVGNRMVFSYDLVGTEKEAEVTLTITIKGRKYTSKDLHLEGDYGKVRPGNGKKIYWNVRWDFPRGLHGHFVADLKSGGRPIRGMVYVKGGCYEMGQSDADKGWLIRKVGRKAYEKSFSGERPRHEICVDDFYMGKYEVTQKEWKAVMGSNPSYFKSCGGRCPVEQVSWNDVQEYIKKLNRKTGRHYRLPTEAEWEYGAREQGKRVRFGTGKDTIGAEEANFSEKALPVDSLATYYLGPALATSNVSKESDESYSRAGVYRSKTMPVGSFAPNALGLYDMSGNVGEWAGDWYGGDYYSWSPRNNPKGPSGGSDRVIRGGSWGSKLRYCRAASRDYGSPSFWNFGIGFRLVVGSSPGR